MRVRHLGSFDIAGNGIDNGDRIGRYLKESHDRLTAAPAADEKPKNGSYEEEHHCPNNATNHTCVVVMSR